MSLRVESKKYWPTLAAIPRIKANKGMVFSGNILIIGSPPNEGINGITNPISISNIVFFEFSNHLISVLILSLNNWNWIFPFVFP